MLDVGRGTSQLAIPLRRRFGAVIGVDADAEMIVEARRQAEAAGVPDITWLVQPAEQSAPALGPVRLVTIGRAFHWMRRHEVLRRCLAVLEPGGALAILGDGRSIWSGDQAWERATTEVVRRWLGPARRAADGVFAVDETPYAEALERAGFRWLETAERVHRQRWTVESITGWLYSTSFCRRAYLGESAPAFEVDPRQTLLALEPSGQFEHETTYSYLLGWKA